MPSQANTQQRRKTILRGLDTQLDFFLRARDHILAGNNSAGTSARRSPEQGLRSLNGGVATPAPRAPYVSPPLSDSARTSVIEDPFAPPGPLPPYRNLRLEYAKEEEERRNRECQAAFSALKEQTTPAPHAPYVSPPPSASTSTSAHHSLFVDPFAPAELCAEPGPGFCSPRLEYPMDREEEEKSAREGQAVSSVLKEQTTSTGLLAVPGTANSLRNICMRYWNTQQQGGQGLATEFHAYFKALSKEDKAPFMRELRQVQGAARRAARMVAKQTDVVSAIN